MLTSDQIVSLSITQADFELAKKFAGSAVMGGMGSIIQDREVREQNRTHHQLIGQLGTLAGHRYLFGHLDLYRESRGKASINPYQSDGGTDVPGANIDFKASHRKYRNKDLLSYNLWVRETELHPNTVYILILIDLEGPIAHLIGWAETRMLREDLVKNDVIKRYGMVARDLNPLPPLFWNIEWTTQRLLSSALPVGA